MIILSLCFLFNHSLSSSLNIKNEIPKEIGKFNPERTREISEFLTEHYSQNFNDIAKIIETYEYIPESREHQCKSIGKRFSGFALALGMTILAFQDVQFFGNSISEINSRKFENDNEKAELIPNGNEHVATFHDNPFGNFKYFEFLKEKNIKSEMNHDISREIRADRLIELPDIPIQSLSKD